MRKIVLLMHVSLDGYVAGPNGEMDWIVYNDELEQYSHALHESMDTAIYGRVTYDMMAGYWPTVLTDPDSSPGEMEHARWVDSATKIVLSRTLDEVTWRNTVVIKDRVAEQITAFKQQPGKDMWLLGSPSVAQLFMQLDLLDEYRINVNPVVLGSGKPLFGRLNDARQLNLLASRTLKGGVAALHYEAVRT